MKIKLPDNLNPTETIRRCGYGKIHDRRTGQESYVRRLGSNFYPRFHVYLEGDYINLHLDQKQASYEGTSAHSGEYDGEVVEQEGERIKNIMANLDISENESEPEVKKGFWGKFF